MQDPGVTTVRVARPVFSLLRGFGGAVELAGITWWREEETGVKTFKDLMVAENVSATKLTAFFEKWARTGDVVPNYERVAYLLAHVAKFGRLDLERLGGALMVWMIGVESPEMAVRYLQMLRYLLKDNFDLRVEVRLKGRLP